MIRSILLAICFFSQTVMAEVTVSDAWARLLPPVVKTTAAYMTLMSSEQDSLVSASSPRVGRVEIHRSSMEDGVMSMEQVEQLTLEPGKPVELSPGGYHFMLIGLKESLKEGELIPMTLRFSRAGDVEVKLPVKR